MLLIEYSISKVCYYRWDVLLQVGWFDVCERIWGEQYILSLRTVYVVAKDTFVIRLFTFYKSP